MWPRPCLAVQTKLPPARLTSPVIESRSAPPTWVAVVDVTSLPRGTKGRIFSRLVAELPRSNPTSAFHREGERGNPNRDDSARSSRTSGTTSRNSGSPLIQKTSVAADYQLKEFPPGSLPIGSGANVESELGVGGPWSRKYDAPIRARHANTRLRPGIVSPKTITRHLDGRHKAVLCGLYRHSCVPLFISTKVDDFGPRVRGKLTRRFRFNSLQIPPQRRPRNFRPQNRSSDSARLARSAGRLYRQAYPGIQPSRYPAK